MSTVGKGQAQATCFSFLLRKHFHPKEHTVHSVSGILLMDTWADMDCAYDLLTGSQTPLTKDYPGPQPCPPPTTAAAQVLIIRTVDESLCNVCYAPMNQQVSEEAHTDADQCNLENRWRLVFAVVIRCEPGFSPGGVGWGGPCCL